MQKNVKSYAKLFLPAFASLALFVSGCGSFSDTDSKEAKKYEAAKAIDSGNFSKAKKMLEKDCAGYSFEECQLNLGAAYLGESGFDVISLGGDLIKAQDDDPEKEEQAITEVIFGKLLSSDVKVGAQYYKLVLPKNFNADKCELNATTYDSATISKKAKCHDNKKLCKAGVNSYDSLNRNQKQACIAINPILLQEIMGEESSGSSNSVDLETIIEFKEVLDSAIPGLDTTDIVAIISSGALPSDKDINGNNVPDGLEATNCAIEAYSSGTYDNTACSDNAELTFDAQESSVDVNGSSYEWIKIRMTDVDVTTFKYYVRLVKDISVAEGTPLYTTVTTTENNITAAGLPCDDHMISDPTVDGACFPEPKKDESGEVENFGSFAVDIINNDTLLESMAQMTDTSGDTNSSSLKEDICKDENDVNLCVDSNGDPVDEITQGALLNFLQTN